MVGKIVSIIIPIYNVAPYIERCLRSVMQQTFSDIECILVDDCGTDNSIEIAEKLINQYQGPIVFKVLHHEHNRGLSAARNTGTIAAEGEFVFYLDSDDAISNNTISILVSEVKKHPELEMVVGNIQGFPHKEYYNLKFSKYPFRIINDNKKIRLYYYSKKPLIPVYAWNKLVKRSFLLNNDLFFKEGIIFEDEYWMFLLVKIIKNISFLQERTYYYYSTPNSIMNSINEETDANTMLSILKDQVINIDSPLQKIQLFRCYYRYCEVYHKSTDRDSLKYVRKKLLFLSIKFCLFKLSFLCFVHPFSNRLFQIMKFQTVPKLYNRESVAI